MFRGQKINKQKPVKPYLLKQPSKRGILSAIITLIPLVPVFLEVPILLFWGGIQRFNLWWHCSSFEISSTFQSLRRIVGDFVLFCFVFSESHKLSSSLTHKGEGSPVYIFGCLVVFKTRELLVFYLGTEKAHIILRVSWPVSSR